MTGKDVNAPNLEEEFPQKIQGSNRFSGFNSGRLF